MWPRYVRPHRRLSRDFQADTDALNHAPAVLGFGVIIVHYRRFGKGARASERNFAAAQWFEHARAQGHSMFHNRTRFLVVVVHNRRNRMELNIGSGQSCASSDKAARLRAIRRQRSTSLRSARAHDFLELQPLADSSFGAPAQPGHRMILQPDTDRQIAAHRMPSRVRSCAGPIPESMSNCGELYAPAARITSASASARSSRPSRANSTAQARCRSNKIRGAWALMRTWRFALLIAGCR